MFSLQRQKSAINSPDYPSSRMEPGVSSKLKALLETSMGCWSVVSKFFALFVDLLMQLGLQFNPLSKWNSWSRGFPSRKWSLLELHPNCNGDPNQLIFVTCVVFQYLFFRQAATARMFCLSANEQRKRDQIAASKSDGNAYVIAVVDNLVPGSEFSSGDPFR